MNPILQHNYAKRCKTSTVLVQGELFLQQMQPPSWIEINQSEDSKKQICFLCSTFVRHFGSKSTNQRTAAKWAVSSAVRMSAILDRKRPIRGQEENDLFPM